jgi:AcrR family transcriptional regulator
MSECTHDRPDRDSGVKRRATRPAASKPRRVRARTARPRGRRADLKQATRAGIVTAALDLFRSKGFDETTTKAIARRAGIAEGTVFNYFPTKEDIALHFFNQELDHAIDAVRGNPRLAKAPLQEKLFALVHSQLDYLAPYERFIGAAVVHALRPTSKLGPFSTSTQILYLRYVDFVEQLMNESLPKQRGTLTRLWAPRAFWLFYLGVVLYWLHDSSEDKQDTLALLDRSLTVAVPLLFGGTRR